MRTLASEAASPKYALIERERRWLVDPARRPRLDGLPHILLEDRYIVGTRLRLRRMTDSATGQVSPKLTRKYEADDVRARPLVTAYLTVAEHDLLAALPAHPLVKRRYTVEGYSLDLFDGALAGLELAERECATEAELLALVAPSWAVREVTDEPRYAGGALAAAGIVPV